MRLPQRLRLLVGQVFCCVSPSSVKSLLDVLYANTVEPRAGELRRRFALGPPWKPGTPLLLQISQSAFQFAVEAGLGSDVKPETKLRAREVERLLDAFEPPEWWHENSEKAAAVPTSLSKIDPETSRLLIHHGYTLAMAELHISVNARLTSRVSVDDVVESVLSR